jgi:hypothetical protein
MLQLLLMPLPIYKPLYSGTILNSFFLFLFALMIQRHCLIYFFCWIVQAANGLQAQSLAPLYAKDTKAAARERLYKNLVQNTIIKNFGLSLSDSTEEAWMDAMYAVQLTRYTAPWIKDRVTYAFSTIQSRSLAFKRSLAEMLYDTYPGIFEQQVSDLFNHTADPLLLAICGEYLLRIGNKYHQQIVQKCSGLPPADSSQVHLNRLISRVQSLSGSQPVPSLKELLYHTYFDSAVVVFSLQRKNRNYPGIALVRDKKGHFVKDDSGNFFAIPQLARSISNLPGYISNGNTPQGIFRMYGTAVSKSNFIGPTPNIQLTMPVEASLQHFINDSTITDTAWTWQHYRNLLPGNWKNFAPVYEAYFAGRAGRTEIIAHGSTVDPAYYKGQSYYPLTPTLGCLCTMELWSGTDGKRMFSDQQRLVDALARAGGANGYYLVVEIDDAQRPVELKDVVEWLHQ